MMEIGCATGELLAAFPGKVTKRGFDISPLNVAAARARYPDIDFVAGDFAQSDARADVVILSDILEHVPDDVGFLRAASAHAPVALINQTVRLVSIGVVASTTARSMVFSSSRTLPGHSYRVNSSIAFSSTPSICLPVRSAAFLFRSRSTACAPTRRCLQAHSSRP